jgi:hypothetical protein
MQLAGVVENSQSGAWQNFKNKLNVLNVDIGTKLNPTFQALIDKVIAAANWFTNLDSGTQQHIITAGLLVIALGPVLSTFGAFTQVIGGTLQILGGLTKFIFETLLPALVGTEKAAALTKLALQGLGMTVSIVIVAASVYAAVEAVKSLIGYMQELRNLENTRQQEKDQIDSIYRRAKQEEDMGNKDKAAQLRNIANKAANAAGYYNVTNANPLVNFGMVKKHTGGTIRANSGVLIPGASPLRDRVPVMAEGGEGIMSRKAIENLLQNGVMPQGPQKVNNINFYVSQLLATPGEARAFARKIKELIDQDDSRYAGGLAR